MNKKVYCSVRYLTPTTVVSHTVIRPCKSIHNGVNITNVYKNVPDLLNTDAKSWSWLTSTIFIPNTAICNAKTIEITVKGTMTTMRTFWVRSSSGRRIESLDRLNRTNNNPIYKSKTMIVLPSDINVSNLENDIPRMPLDSLFEASRLMRESIELDAARQILLSR